jgi:hypothetical protein
MRHPHLKQGPEFGERAYFDRKPFAEIAIDKLALEYVLLSVVEWSLVEMG